MFSVDDNRLTGNIPSIRYSEWKEISKLMRPFGVYLVCLHFFANHSFRFCAWKPIPKHVLIPPGEIHLEDNLLTGDVKPALCDLVKEREREEFDFAFTVDCKKVYCPCCTNCLVFESD